MSLWEITVSLGEGGGRRAQQVSGGPREMLGQQDLDEGLSSLLEDG